MRRLLACFLAFCLSCTLWAKSAKWTEHRRALLVHAGTDKAHADKVKELETTLQSKGFLTQLIGNKPRPTGPYENGSAAYPPWASACSITSMVGNGEESGWEERLPLDADRWIQVLLPARDPDWGGRERRTSHGSAWSVCPKN